MIQCLKLIKSYSDTPMFKLLDKNTVICKTYEDYLNDLGLCAYRLEEILGSIEGKHIGILAGSDYEYLVLLSSIIFSRGVAVPLNEKETADNISFAIRNADLDALIVDEEHLENGFENIVCLKKDDVFGDLKLQKKLVDFTDEEENNLALIIHTSGTTSMSKGVALSAGNLFHDIRYALPSRYIENPESARGVQGYINFPFYHVAGIYVWVYAIEMGITICVSKDPRNVLFDLENIRLGFAAVTPALVKLWTKCIIKGRMDRLGYVKDLITAGAAIEPEVARLFISEGITMGQFYGQTETGGAVTFNSDMEGHITSVGKPIRDAEFSVRDGEICIEYWGNMLGYYNNPEETAKYLIDGVLHTGDLGYIDEDGYIYITGRKKNLIILSGGENISPEEIEVKLCESGLIKECRAIEKNDRIAVEIFAPGASREEVKEHIDKFNRKMPIYKRIYSYELQEHEFDKTALGKMKR